MDRFDIAGLLFLINSILFTLCAMFYLYTSLLMPGSGLHLGMQARISVADKCRGHSVTCKHLWARIPVIIERLFFLTIQVMLDSRLYMPYVGIELALIMLFCKLSPKMTVLYTQILNNSDQKILTGDFSPQSMALKPDNEVLKELRSVTKLALSRNGTNLYTFESKNKDFMFYLKPENGICVAVITDKYSHVNIISQFMTEVHSEFLKIYNPTGKTTYYGFDTRIKELSAKFNKEHLHLQSLSMVEETKGILAESLNLITKRGENIDNLKGLATRMTLEAQQMQKNVQRMRLQSIVNEYWVYLFLLLVVALFYYIIKR